ncbi:MAG: hypothetical protein J5J00_12120 [Deltaproteobacteria bacterium]|nr:hypothetical protein [Deltaproteobacteria bacterium]
MSQKNSSTDSEAKLKALWPDFLRVWPQWTNGASFGWVEISPSLRERLETTRDFNSCPHFTFYFFAEEELSFLYAKSPNDPGSMPKAEAMALAELLLSALLKGTENPTDWHLIRIGKKWS